MPEILWFQLRLVAVFLWFIHLLVLFDSISWLNVKEKTLKKTHHKFWDNIFKCLGLSSQLSTTQIFNLKVYTTQKSCKSTSDKLQLAKNWLFCLVKWHPGLIDYLNCCQSATHYIEYLFLCVCFGQNQPFEVVTFASWELWTLKTFPSVSFSHTLQTFLQINL